jgi:hypothetical protein
MQWVPNEKKEQPEQEPDDLTIAYMAGFYDGKNTPQRKPEQEPVAWMDEYGDVLSANVVDGNGLRNIPLYTTPPKREWVGLTDKEMEEAMDYWSDPSRSAYGGAWSADSECVDMVRTWRYIEAKLRQKNT